MLCMTVNAMYHHFTTPLRIFLQTRLSEVPLLERQTLVVVFKNVRKVQMVSECSA